MHKSRIGVLVIDCKTNDLKRESEFWGKALGCSRKFFPENDNYIQLETAPDEIKMLLQKVEHPSRVHLDIETDNIKAEVERLKGLGAKIVKRVSTWVVMEAPSGHRFCVVQPQRANFETGSNVWE